MMLTYKIKHSHDFSEELRKAKQVAEFAIRTRSRSSSDVKHIGLKSAIANQILKKYSHNKDCKEVHRVVLTIPNQSVKTDKINHTISIPCLKLELPYQFRNDFSKISQIEIDKDFAYVSVSVPEQEIMQVNHYIGVDRNTTHHSVVVGNPTTGKVWKLGKQAEHIHKKYREMRRHLQSKGKLRKLKRIKRREHNKVKDLNHKISRKIVDIALENKCGIKMELLDGIRNNRKHRKTFNHSLHSWGFYQQQNMVEYKARLFGVPGAYVEPAWTSQDCSKCGLRGIRNGIVFKCPHCGHVEDANANASFNIALRPSIVDFIPRLHKDRDLCKGSTDTPKEATL